MFYYVDKNDFLRKSTIELNNDNLTLITKEEYEKRMAAIEVAALEEVGE